LAGMARAAAHGVHAIGPTSWGHANRP
jgi:hypothetical protein